MSECFGQLPFAPSTRTLEGDWRFEALPKLEGKSVLPYGLGRSYGDSCINSNAYHISTTRLNRFIRFDSSNGLLECEAGVSLDEILKLIVPKGWFLAVVPGTRFVTLGGAIANDVHGKNHHHMGSFGCHVNSLHLLRSSGERLHCSSTENPHLFAATIAGLGLTGLIVSAEIQLMKIPGPHLATENVPFDSLEEFTQINEDSADWEYTVAWIDASAGNASIGRGIFTRAKHTSGNPGVKNGISQWQPSVPITPPFSCINKATVSLFNKAYYYRNSRKLGLNTNHYQSFFFPLDSIRHWNRIYGTSGFYQYQCVLPTNTCKSALARLLSNIKSSGQGSFLTVLKTFGDKRSPGLLSFPRPGITLAIDFPNRGEKTRALLSTFDEIIRAEGGALYPAKDARMPAELFSSGFSQLETFRKQIDPHFSSAFWRRIQN